MYRGYPIEQLAKHSSFLEVAYLLMHGELPTAAEFSAFAFYPIALDGISRLAATARGRRAVVAAAGIAVVVLCHPPAALLFMPLAACFAVFECARHRSVRAFDWTRVEYVPG